MANIIPTLKIKDKPDWKAIEDYLEFTKADYISFANIIVEGMAYRIRNESTTADGRPLSENNKWWIAQKLREGKPTIPLWYTGKLSEPTTYLVKLSEGATIELRPDYRQIHLNLIEISEKTGKNYKDWFGIGKDDLKLIDKAAEEILKEKIRRLTGR